MSNIIGIIGTTVIIVGYLPQIIHLVKEKCSWGISLRSWLIWLFGGVFLFIYSVMKSDIVFTVVQIIHIIAIGITIYFARKSSRVCPYHLKK